MHGFLENILALKLRWNERPLTEEDFYRICRRNKVSVTEMPLVTNGFYYCVKGRHYIAISSRLKGNEKLFVMFHELAHFLMHAPDSNATANFSGIGKPTRKEKEADAFAYCAILPKRWIEQKTLRDLVEDEGFTEEFIAERKEVFRRYGV